MIQLDGLDLPTPVRRAVEELDGEIDVQKYSVKGANGHLFFGSHRILNRQIAIKFYYWGGTRSHDEPRLLSEIEADHVIPVLSASLVDNEWAMFQTPYYQRGDMDRLITRGSLSLHQAIDHTIEILAGVSALHAPGLVHRDLKPSNIFIDDEGRARIGDFGSVMSLPVGSVEVQGSGHTVLYRPPESFQHGTYGKPGDLYQCGIVLFQLLGGLLPSEPEIWLDRSGKKCWEAATTDFERSRCVDESIARKAVNQRLLDLSTLPDTVPTCLKTLIRRATRPNQVDRYAAPSQMMNDLRQARANCMNWLWDGGEAYVTVADRRVRLIKESAGSDDYRVECDKGRGWRKAQGTESGSLVSLVREVEYHLRARA
jgi:serine/threonine protein kinase